MFEVIYSSGWFVGWVFGMFVMAIVLVAIILHEPCGIDGILHEPCGIDGIDVISTAVYVVLWPVVVLWVLYMFIMEYFRLRQQKRYWQSTKYWRPRG